MAKTPNAALVSGGASGLGAATVRRLVDAGFYCIVFDRDEAAAAAAAERLGERGASVAGDITDPQSVTAGLDAAGDRPLQVVVNCAFRGAGAPILSVDGTPLDLAVFRSLIDVNITGTFNVMRLAAERMARNTPDAQGQRGVIINTASLAAFEGQASQFAYATAKAAVAGMALPAARDLAQFGIRVMTIAPGTFATPPVMALPESYRQDLADAPLFPRRLGDPDDYARLVMSIVDNPFLNAEVIRIDAGARLPGPGWRYVGGRSAL